MAFVGAEKFSEIYITLHFNKQLLHYKRRHGTNQLCVFAVRINEIRALLNNSQLLCHLKLKTQQNLSPTLVPVNKLVSLMWLLWALRSFRSFTLHYNSRSVYTRECYKIRETFIIIIIVIIMRLYEMFLPNDRVPMTNEWYGGGGIASERLCLVA